MQAPDYTQPLALGSNSLTWRTPPLSQIVGCALPSLGLGDRLVLRALALIASRHVVAMHGLQHIRPATDPFILAANHSTRRKSLLVPALLLLHRGGRLVHFLADWNFRLIPGVGFIYARAQVVTVTRKSAKPRFLNALKPLYEHPQPTLERARSHLAAGRAIGTRVMGFIPVATHELGELNCTSRRITLVLDLKSSYQRLKARGNWVFRYLTAH